MMNNLFKLNNNSNSGITLLALIITIAVMLIFLGISFTAFLDEGRNNNTNSRLTICHKQTNHRISTQHS